MTTTSTQTFDDVDQALLTEIQQQFPIDHRPFELLGRKLEISEQDCLRRVERLKDQRTIRQICASFDARTLGYERMLVAMRVEPDRADEAAGQMIQYPGVSHSCKRNDPFNLWLTIAVPPSDAMEQVVNILNTLVKVEDTILLPTLHVYKSDKRPDLMAPSEPWEGPEDIYDEKSRVVSTLHVNDQDIRFIRILQDDVPLIEMPFTVLAEQAGASEEELFAWMRKAERLGALRSYAAAVHDPKADAMTSILVVWQVPGEQVDQVGAKIATFREVSRCYGRPVYPSWPYSLFTVIRAQTSSACMEAVKRVEEQVGRLPHKNLYTTKEYKRERLRYFSPDLDAWWKQVGLPGMRVLEERRDT